MHAYIISELKSRLPFISRFMGKSEYQNELIDNLEGLYNDIQSMNKNISSGDFPDVNKMKVSKGYIYDIENVI